MRSNSNRKVTMTMTMTVLHSKNIYFDFVS